MKKRIISLVLVIVMASLVLVSCGYSYAKDDMANYASFENIEAFKAALKELKIEDGDYTTDQTTRDNKVYDSIYSELATAAKSGEKKYEGAVGAHDLFYYTYYCTADFDGTTATFFTSYMKTDSALNLQFGKKTATELENKIIAAVNALGDLKDKVYTSDTSGTVKDGDIVFVSYKYTHQVEVLDKDGNVQKDENGNPVTKEETVTVTNERLVLTKGASLFIDHLLGVYAEGETEKKAAGIGSSATVEDFTTANGVKYTGIKVNFRANGESLPSFTNVTFDETRTVTDTNGVSRDLKGKELTYYVYPVYYISVDEFNATNLINTIFSSNISADGLGIVLVKGYEDMEEEERKTALESYVITAADGTKTTLADICEKLATLQKDLTSAKTAYDKAVTDLETKQAAYDDAKAKADAAGEAVTEAQTDTLNKATKNLEDAQKAHDEAKTKYDTAKTDRDNKVNELLTVKENMAALLVEGYERVTHEHLLDNYNNEIKMNLAEKVYELLEKHVKVNSVPEEAAKLTYDQLVDNYKAAFYDSNNSGYYYDSDKKISNYKQYKGDFDKYFIDAVTKDVKKVTTLEEAEAALLGKAEELNKPIVMIYTAAAAYGLTLSDDEFKTLKEDDDSYYSNEYQYGEGSVRHAYQFDKLMNDILARTENEDGSYTYTNVAYTIGEDTPEEAPEEGGEESAE